MRDMRNRKKRKSSKTAKKGRGRGQRSLVEMLRSRHGLAGIGTASFALLVTALAWSGWFGHQADRLVATWYKLTAEAGLSVQDVLLVGRKRSSKNSVLNEVQVARGTPILSIDPAEVKTRLEDLPWVSQATVERRLPRLLVIHLEERQPMALWQYRGRKAVIDGEGAVIPGAKPESFAALPLVVGKDAPLHAAELLQLLRQEPSLQPLVTAAVRVGSRRWNLRLEGGIDVRLPEQDAAEAWAELARVERDHGLLKREIVAIDLRVSDRMILRMAPGAAPIGNEDQLGKET